MIRSSIFIFKFVKAHFAPFLPLLVVTNPNPLSAKKGIILTMKIGGCYCKPLNIHSLKGKAK
jgi:hypothetical protein